MSLLYNIDFEIAVIGYLLILYVFLCIQYSEQSEINKKFRRLTFFVLVSDIMDVVTAVTISYGTSVPVWLNVAMNTIYLGLAAEMAYYFMGYVAAYIPLRKDRGTFFLLHRGILLAYFAVLIVNLFTGLLFFFNEQKEYVHGSLYLCVYIIPLYFIAVTFFVFLRNQKCFTFMQQVSILFFIILAMIGSVLQMVFFPQVLLSIFTVAVADLIIFFAMVFVKPPAGKVAEDNHAANQDLFKGNLSETKIQLDTAVETQKQAVHILVVDDDPMNLYIAERILKEKYQVSCVKSGEEALNFLKKELPDLVLLDIHMPEMDGFEVIDRMRAVEKYSGLPVIFLTADDERDAEVKGFKHGALDFITKPFIADIMIQRVKRILELDRLQKNLKQEVARQTKKAEERRQKIERMSDQIMQALASTIDAKDKYTNGHSVRVAEYSREMMRRIGGTEQEQEDVYYIGLLHDIGKIGIPDAIISKSSGLTDEEYSLIKSHPVIGADILKNISEIPGIDVGARWHHEKYDGTGYPDGLKGEEIPRMARLIGVADAYDAMASKRSYRDVLPQEVVREEIEKGKGTQFDPYFADIMLQMIADDVDYNMREA